MAPQKMWGEQLNELDECRQSLPQLSDGSSALVGVAPDLCLA